MLGRVITTKYTNLNMPIIYVYINNIFIPNNLIDSGSSINVMTKETMKRIKLTNLQQTPIVFQLEDRSTIKLNLS
jgi:hypothetical protein